MSSTRGSLLVVVLVLLVCEVASAAGLPTEGTVSGALTVNGKKFPLTHVYARKREAWPADAKELGLKDVSEISCGIVEIIMTNAALPAATLTAILQHDYRGSETIRGVHFLIDTAGDKWEPLFLLESGSVHGYGMTQSSASVEGGPRWKGKVSVKNEDVTQVRALDVTFDTPLKIQYARTETETAERIPDARVAEEFLAMLPGEWKIDRWLGLGCTTASGTLVVGERVSPHAFHATFHIVTSKGDKVEEEATLSLVGTKVHVQGDKVNVAESVWIPDVLDLELWKNLMIGNNATDFVVMRKESSPL